MDENNWAPLSAHSHSLLLIDLKSRPGGDGALANAAAAGEEGPFAAIHGHATDLADMAGFQALSVREQLLFSTLDRATHATRVILSYCEREHRRARANASSSACCTLSMRRFSCIHRAACSRLKMR